MQLAHISPSHEASTLYVVMSLLEAPKNIRTTRQGIEVPADMAPLCMGDTVRMNSRGVFEKVGHL